MFKNVTVKLQLQIILSGDLTGDLE